MPRRRARRALAAAATLVGAAQGSAVVPLPQDALSPATLGAWLPATPNFLPSVPCVEVVALQNSLRLRILMRDAWTAERDDTVAQSVRARTFCVDFTYFHIHCEFHCEIQCEMVQSFHCESTVPCSDHLDDDRGGQNDKNSSLVSYPLNY